MRLDLAALLLPLSPVAAASGTLCMFEPPAHSPIPSLEFVGRETIGPVLVHGPDGPRALPAGSWKVVTFDLAHSKLQFAYTNPGNRSFPPSFTLQGELGSARLVTSGRRFAGEFRCGAW